jgi:lysophospholipase L1-like esterase
MGKRARIVGFVVLVVGVLVPAASALASPQYVALGDSYSSGVGSRTFYEESGECKRSPYAYGPLVAAADGYTLSFLACGGAKTNEVVEKQLGTLSSSTALVTITIGGNDAGFGHVMEECAVYYFWCGEAIEEADTYIKNSLPKALETTYKAIRAKATTAKIVVLGYPKLFTKEGATCGVNTLTSSHEKKINESAEKLDAAVKARAEALKFTFTNPTSAFESHEICSSSEWLNGESDPLGESYHPNTKGQEEFAKLVEAAI